MADTDTPANTRNGRRDERWIYAGLRLAGDRKRFAAWIPEGSDDELLFAHKTGRTWAIGGIYAVTVSRDDNDRVTVHNFASTSWVGRLTDQAERARLELLDREAQDTLSGMAFQRKLKAARPWPTPSHRCSPSPRSCTPPPSCAPCWPTSLRRSTPPDGVRSEPRRARHRAHRPGHPSPRFCSSPARYPAGVRAAVRATIATTLADIAISGALRTYRQLRSAAITDRHLPAHRELLACRQFVESGPTRQPGHATDSYLPAGR